MSIPEFEQAPPSGVEPPRRRSDRLFFAIVPDAKAASRIERLARELRGDLGLRGKLIERERLHVTLFFVGDFAGVPDGAVDALSRIAGSVTDTTAPFEVGFDRVASFPRKDRRRPLVLQGDDGVLALTALHERLQAAMAEAALAPRATRYTPHLTLLYDDRTVADLMIDPIIWPVREFVLVHSLIGRSRHETIARLPLRG